MKTKLSTTIVGAVMFVLFFNIIGQHTMNLAWAEDDNSTGKDLGTGINVTSTSGVNTENSLFSNLNGTKSNNNDKDKSWENYQGSLHKAESDYQMSVANAAHSYYQSTRTAETTKQQTISSADQVFRDTLKGVYQTFETAEDNAKGDKQLIIAAEVARDTGVGNAKIAFDTVIGQADVAQQQADTAALADKTKAIGQAQAIKDKADGDALVNYDNSKGNGNAGKVQNVETATIAKDNSITSVNVEQIAVNGGFEVSISEAKSNQTISVDGIDMNFDVAKDNAIGNKSLIANAAIARDQSMTTVQENKDSTVWLLDAYIDKENAKVTAATDAVNGIFEQAKDTAYSNSLAVTRDQSIENAEVTKDNVNGQSRISIDNATKQFALTVDAITGNANVARDKADGNQSVTWTIFATQDQAVANAQVKRDTALWNARESIDQENASTQAAKDTALGDYNIAKDNAENNTKAATRDKAIEQANVQADNSFGQNQIAMDNLYSQAEISKDTSDGNTTVAKDQAIALAWS